MSNVYNYLINDKGKWVSGKLKNQFSCVGTPKQLGLFKVK